MLCVPDSSDDAGQEGGANWKAIVLQLLKLKAIIAIGIAPQLRTFSPAWSPPIRSLRYPWGRPHLAPDLWNVMMTENGMMKHYIELFRVAMGTGIYVWLVFFEIEPDLVHSRS